MLVHELDGLEAAEAIDSTGAKRVVGVQPRAAPGAMAFAGRSL